MNTIEPRNKEKVFRYVTDAISLYEPGTTRLSGDNIFKFDRIAYILGNLIRIQGFPENNDQKRVLIRRGIVRFINYRRKSVDSFLRALRTEIRQRRRQTPSKFFVVFPLNISYRTLEGKRHFTIASIKLRTRSFAHVGNNFDFRRPYNILRRSREIEGSIYDFTYVIVEVQARSQSDAFEIARQRVELFRSLCNFVLSYGRITWQMGYPSALGRINPSKYMFIFDDDRKYLDHWFSVGEFRYRLLRLQHDELEVVNKDMKAFEALNPNKLKNILINCLTLYSYALDEIEPGYIFLNLWQILEIIALKDQSGIKLKKVRDRIEAIFKKNPIISDVLDALFRKRNRLVHEGRLRSFSLRDVNQIKGIAEGCINFLFGHVNRLKTVAGLQDFYENIGAKGERLDKRMAVLRYVKKVQTT